MSRIAAKRIQPDSDVSEGPPGCIEFVACARRDETPAGIEFQCPCGCGNVGWLAFDNGENPHPKWKFDGNLDAPTITPSVFNTGMPCRWHGWLRAGYWESV